MVSKRQLELSDLLGKLDAAIGEARAEMDDHARGRRYQDLGVSAARLVRDAATAIEHQRELDRLLTAEWEKSRGRGEGGD